eukprot:2091216-Rhodomonas_salina.1
MEPGTTMGSGLGLEEDIAQTSRAPRELSADVSLHAEGREHGVDRGVRKRGSADEGHGGLGVRSSETACMIVQMGS